MTVDHFAPQVDGVRLSLLQFFVVAVESTAAALLFENPTLAEFGANWLPLAYCGVMSSGVAYTLQILGQRDVNPAIASLIMCLERVQRAGRLAAAPPESFHAGGLWLHPHLCSGGSGPAARGGLAEMPQRKPEVTRRTAAGIPTS